MQMGRETAWGKWSFAYGGEDRERKEEMSGNDASIPSLCLNTATLFGSLSNPIAARIFAWSPHSQMETSVTPGGCFNSNPRPLCNSLEQILTYNIQSSNYHGLLCTGQCMGWRISALCSEIGFRLHSYSTYCRHQSLAKSLVPVCSADQFAVSNISICPRRLCVRILPPN